MGKKILAAAELEDGGKRRENAAGEEGASHTRRCFTDVNKKCVMRENAWVVIIGDVMQDSQS